MGDGLASRWRGLLGFRDNGKGALVRFRACEPEARIGLQYYVGSGASETTSLDVKESYASRYGLRQRRLKEQELMRPVGCVAGRKEAGVYGVAFQDQFVRVGVHAGEVLLAKEPKHQ